MFRLVVINPNVILKLFRVNMYNYSRERFNIQVPLYTVILFKSAQTRMKYELSRAVNNNFDNNAYSARAYLGRVPLINNCPLLAGGGAHRSSSARRGLVMCWHNDLSFAGLRNVGRRNLDTASVFGLTRTQPATRVTIKI